MCRGRRGHRGCRGHRGRRSRRGHRGHGSQKCRVGVDILSVDFAQPKFVLSFFSPLSIPFLCSLAFPSTLPLLFLSSHLPSSPLPSPFFFFTPPSSPPLPRVTPPPLPLPTPYFTVTLYRNEPLQMMMKRWAKLDKVHVLVYACASILSLVSFPDLRYGTRTRVLLRAWETLRVVQDCQQRLSSAFDLILIFLCPLIQTLTLTPPPNNAANLDMYAGNETIYCL